MYTGQTCEKCKDWHNNLDLKSENYGKNFPDGQLSFINDGVYDESTLRFSKTFFVQPEVGKLIIFPGSLGHLVYPFKGPGTRIVLAVNWGRVHK